MDLKGFAVSCKKIALIGAAAGMIALTGCSRAASTRTRSGERLSDRLNNAIGDNYDYYSNDYGRVYGNGRLDGYRINDDGFFDSDTAIDRSYRNNGQWSNAATPTPITRGQAKRSGANNDASYNDGN
jgi:hypothetical protein